jgi:endoglucanase
MSPQIKSSGDQGPTASVAPEPVLRPVTSVSNEPSAPAPRPTSSSSAPSAAGGAPAANSSADAGRAGEAEMPTGQAGSGQVGGTGGAAPSVQAGGAAGVAGSPGAGGTPVTITGDTPVERNGQLHVDGNRLVGEHGLPVTLRGQGFAWDNWWPQYYNADVVDWLRDDWCVDMVRPAMGIEPDGAYLQDPDASKARVYAVIEAAIARGIYVIVDWHAHDLHQSEAVDFFSEVAQRYGDEPSVIYEVFNEPEGETWPEVKAYAEAVIAAIRQYDPDNLVIVGSPEWDQRVDLVAADPITSDDNVIYSVHFYAASHGAWLRDRAAAALASGIPLFVSESSGSEAAGTGNNDYTEWQAWFDFMDENQISWIDYSVSDKAGETISVLQPGASSSGGWDDSQLTETGKYIRDVLRSYCP